jgi:DNA-binding GntR family transcriptional regulator
VRFHITLSEATGTRRLIAAMTEVQGAMSELIALIAHPDMVLPKANEEHRKVVRCLRDGNGVGAVKILRAHLLGTEHIIAGLIPSGAASAV